MTKLFSISTIRKKVKEYGKIIEAPSNLLTLRTVSDGFATPFVEIDRNGYNYVVSERGTECSRDITQDLDTLLYWIFRSIVDEMAFDYELAHREEGFDTRRIAFNKMLELMEKLDPKWKQRTMKHLEEVLLENPYSDIVSNTNTVFYWGVELPVPSGFIGCQIKRIDLGSDIEMYHQGKLINTVPKPSSLIPPYNPGVFLTTTKAGTFRYQNKTYCMASDRQQDFSKFAGKKINVKEEIWGDLIYLAVYLDSAPVLHVQKKS